ncbi:hypothetical protein B9Z19DRAFT_1138776 [Tuber borchii]|uniref:Uncharacterized protein n=1 Tax=Tuber borchii TaxID=42251 RepID=A0A2T6Z9M4_TUBBO|nr:hypothetical protein B9Z19DRAFT_1138776 [Tuber borchii]
MEPPNPEIDDPKPIAKTKTTQSEIKKQSLSGEKEMIPARTSNRDAGVKAGGSAREPVKNIPRANGNPVVVKT